MTRTELVSPRQVAEYLGRTEAALAQMRYKSTGPKYLKIGGKVMYEWAEVEAFVDASRCSGSADGTQ